MSRAAASLAVVVVVLLLAERAAGAAPAPLSAGGPAVATAQDAQREAGITAGEPNVNVESKTMTAARVAEPATVTVGEFLLRWAHLLDPDLPENTSIAAAATALTERSRLGNDVNLERPVTEGDVVRFIGQTGVRLTTLHDDRPLPPASIDAFFSRFGAIVGGKPGLGLVFSRAACDPGPQTVGDEAAGADGMTAEPSSRP